MKTENIVKEKSYAFALRIIKAYRFLSSEQREFVLSKQMLRSGTAIGALIREAEYGQSIPDFVHKLSIALKEANETLYWLMLLKDSGYIDERSFSSIEPECIELIKLLTSIINSSKKK
jgi:four helix bundle protein